MKTKQMVLTALLLAMCIVFQSMKGISVYLTGSAVNALLVMATLSVGMSSGVFIAVITPIIAYLMGHTPVMQMIPLMVIVVMVGNLALVLMAGKGRKGNLPTWLAAGAVLKAVVLWLLAVIKTTFSITQLITAAIGCVIAYIIHLRVQHMYFADTKKADKR